ncbi:uncharacterized protein [Onthophagus taurus]|uniref:uncharacterized protein n=1 Tax=Onthophagus taurus TaxID=166361 RepID=UPI000C1FEA93|nr:uncharacterized protein LOC111424961 [Onthophagus taurus]
MKHLKLILIVLNLVSLFGLSISKQFQNETRVSKNTPDCSLYAPSNLTISESAGRLWLSYTVHHTECFILQIIEVFLNGVHSQTIRTMRPDFLIDLPKPCTEVRVFVRSTDDSGVETNAISATYLTEIPTENFGLENMWWMRDSTRIIVTYFPAYPYQNCRFNYEMYYTFMDTNIVIQNTTTTELIRKFNYVEQRLLCRVITMHLTPILNGNRGRTWTENAVTDRFTPDPGPASALTFQISNVLRITWRPPVFYEECIVVYYGEIANVSTGEILGTFRDIETEWIFDYAPHIHHTTTLSIRITPSFLGVFGPSVTTFATLSP